MTRREAKRQAKQAKAQEMCIRDSTKALAGEVIGDGIRVNGVLPGFVRNSRTDKLFETDFEAMEIKRKRLPTQQFGMPEDIGVMVAMLASEKCKLAIGSIVDMTGGLLL